MSRTYVALCCATKHTGAAYATSKALLHCTTFIMSGKKNVRSNLTYRVVSVALKLLISAILGRTWNMNQLNQVRFQTESASVSQGPRCPGNEQHIQSLACQFHGISLSNAIGGTCDHRPLAILFQVLADWTQLAMKNVCDHTTV